MTSKYGASMAEAGRVPLPRHYSSISEIKSAPHGLLVNTIGLVNYVQRPSKTMGTDFKMAFTIYDPLLEEEAALLTLHIFAAENMMPKVDCTNAVVLKNVKVQINGNAGDISLITNYKSELFIFDMKKLAKGQMTRPPNGGGRPNMAYTVWQVDADGPLLRFKYPTESEVEYVSLMFRNRKDTSLDVEVITAQGFNRKDQPLENVVAGRFYNLSVMVAKIIDHGNTASLWVTDFSTNLYFPDMSLPGEGTAGSERPEDRPGYLKSYDAKRQAQQTKEARSAGPNYVPSGKMSIRIICFGSVAEAIRDLGLKPGHWVRLRNVRIREKGFRGVLALEGMLDPDHTYTNREPVVILDPPTKEDLASDSPFSLAYARMLKYRREQASLAKKRKARDSDSSFNQSKREAGSSAKSRRKLARDKERNQAGGADRAGGAGRIHLNAHIKADHGDVGLTPLSAALEPIYCSKTLDDGNVVRLRLPFVNAKFRTLARVVDYMPSNLADFAVTSSNISIDFAEHADLTSDSEGSGDDIHGKPYPAERVWVWRFALQLEDASYAPETTAPRSRIWVVVGNDEGKTLMGLSASDLRHDKETLHNLRERMFLLWGNLDEKKRKERDMQRTKASRAKKAAEEAEARAAAAAAAAATAAKEAKERAEQRERQKQASARLALLNYPEPSISDDEDEAVEQMQKQVEKVLPTSPKEKLEKLQIQENQEEVEGEIPLGNKPFICCVRQFGIQVGDLVGEEAEESEGNSTNGRDRHGLETWQQSFGLFGTMIAYNA